MPAYSRKQQLMAGVTALATLMPSLAPARAQTLKEYQNAAETILSRMPEKYERSGMPKIALSLANEKLVCMIPAGKDAPTILLGSPNDPLFKDMRLSYELAKTFPDFLPVYAIATDGAPTQEVMCQSPLDGGVLAASYYENAFFSIVYRNDNIYQKALNRLHEGYHYRFGLYTQPYKKDFKDRDDAFSYFVNESVAHSFELINAYLAHMQGDSHFWDAKHSIRRKAYIERAAKIYPEEFLKGYIRQHRALPPVMARLIFTYIAGELAQDSYYNGALEIRAEGKGPLIHVGDDFIATALYASGKEWGPVKGMRDFLRLRTPAGYPDIAAGIAALNTAQKVDAVPIYRDMFDTLSVFNSDNAAPSPQQLNAIPQQFNRLRDNGALRYVFALDDINATADFYLGRLPREQDARHRVLQDLKRSVATERGKLCPARGVPAASPSAKASADAC
jgi:hypothetical protein